MTVCDLAASLEAGEVVHGYDGYDVAPAPLAVELGVVGLLDHVGASFYTPATFYAELVKQGPSRKVTADIARQIAPYLPVPILFLFDLPLLPNEEQARAWGYKAGMVIDKHGADPALVHWMDLNQELYSGAAWRHPRFAATCSHVAAPDSLYLGGAHWLARVIAAGLLDELKSYPHAQQAGCISWVTSAVYIAASVEEAQAVEKEMRRQGLDVGLLDGTEAAAAFEAAKEAERA